MPPYEVIIADVMNWAAAYSGPLFHALLCDPPYHLTTITKRFGKEGAAPATGGVYERSSRGFMGQTWDGGDIAFRPETWAAFLPLLHPGAFGMAFASARGWHRMVVAIEDAGFLIHPSIFVWLYGSGFPKATRIDTQIDRAAGAERPVVGEVTFHGHNAGTGAGSFSKNAYEGQTGVQRTEPVTGPATELAKAWEGHRYGSQAIKPAAEPIIVFQKPYDGRPIDEITRTGSGALNISASRLTTTKQEREWMEATARPNQETTGWGENQGSKMRRPPGFKAPEQGRWPANFAMSHRPGCRKVGTQRVQGSLIDKPFEGQVKAFADGGLGGPRPGRGIGDQDGMETVDVWECEADCPVWRLNSQVGERTSGGGPVLRKQDGGYNKDWPMGMQASIYGDSGPVSRFFYNADWSAEIERRMAETDPVRYEEKASRSEREEGLRFVLPCVKCGSLESETHVATLDGKEIEVACRRDLHPTVKPIGLARWLATLLLPPDRYAPRRLFVPFAGVGSEMIGAKQAGWEQVVGVELHEEYVRVAMPRLAAHIGMF